MVNGLFSILFVCLENICRSPAAHGTMEYIIKQKGLQSKIFVDSCGTNTLTPGFLPDPRMIKAGRKRGIEINHLVRNFEKDDYKRFDLIVTMDDQNYETVTELIGKEKVRKMIDFVKVKRGNKEIPDPWYGGPEGFELVLDLVYDGCIGILREYKYI